MEVYPDQSTHFWAALLPRSSHMTAGEGASSLRGLAGGCRAFVLLISSKKVPSRRRWRLFPQLRVQDDDEDAGAQLRRSIFSDEPRICAYLRTNAEFFFNFFKFPSLLDSDLR